MSVGGLGNWGVPGPHRHAVLREGPEGLLNTGQALALTYGWGGGYKILNPGSPPPEILI